jgi:hypothetical protein
MLANLFLFPVHCTPALPVMLGLLWWLQWLLAHSHTVLSARGLGASLVVCVLGGGEVEQYTEASSVVLVAQVVPAVSRAGRQAMPGSVQLYMTCRVDAMA